MKKFIIPFVLIFMSCSQNQHEKSDLKKESEAKTAISSNENFKVALEFINSYVKNCNKLKESMPALDWVNSNNQCTTNFKIALKQIIDQANNNLDMGLELDPILNAQDYPDTGFELESYNKKDNYVMVKGKENSAFKITIKLVEENGIWLVDGCGSINISDRKRSL